MLGYVFAGIALVGSSIAAIIDLKTTEVPDNIPYAMAISALILKLFVSVNGGSMQPLVDSIFVGLAYLAFGFMLYYLGQWGGGDAKILAAIGFLLPSLPAEFSSVIYFSFPFSYLINLFFVGSVYMLFYSLALTLWNPFIAKEFFVETTGKYKQVFLEAALAVSSVLLVPYLVLKQMGLPLQQFFSFIPTLIALSIGMLFLLRFLRSVEKVAFRKKITTANLREGDMIGEDVGELGFKSRLIKGLTMEEVEKIKQIRKEIWIKEGVRFVPAFPLSLLVTLFYGDITVILSSIF